MLQGVHDKIGIESFLTEYPNIKRASMMDYKAGRLKGRVSHEKCLEIEAAALASYRAHIQNSD